MSHADKWALDGLSDVAAAVADVVWAGLDVFGDVDGNGDVEVTLEPRRDNRGSRQSDLWYNSSSLNSRFVSNK